VFFIWAKEDMGTLQTEEDPSNLNPDAIDLHPHQQKDGFKNRVFFVKGHYGKNCTFPVLPPKKKRFKQPNQKNHRGGWVGW